MEKEIKDLVETRIQIAEKPEEKLVTDHQKLMMQLWAKKYKQQNPKASWRQVERAVKRKFNLTII